MKSQKIRTTILGLTFAMLTTTSGQAQAQDLSIYRKISPEEYRKEISLITSALKESLVELYMYQDSVAFEKHLEKLYSKSDSISVKDLYRELKALFAPLGSDHLKVYFSKAIQEATIKNVPLLPLELRFLNGNVYCVYNYAGDEIKKGDQVLKVNGNDMATVAKGILELTSAGGFIQDSKQWVLDDMGFAEKYYLYFDTSQIFRIDYMRPGETNVRTCVLNGKSINEAARTPEILSAENIHLFAEPFAFNVKNGTGIMSIEQFYEDISEKKFNAFYKKCFREMAEKKVQHLVIDIRRNIGGWQRHGYNLMTYFTPVDFSPIESVWFKNKTFSFLSYTDTKPEDLHLDKLEKQGKYYRQNQYRWLTEPVFRPKKKYFFSGKVYVLTNEGTCSAACFFTNAVNTFAPDVVFAGRESEAVCAGASSGFMPVLSLPYSGLKIRLPLAYFKAACAKGLAYGRGLIPDHIIQKDLSGADLEMDYILKLIEQDKANKQ